MTRKRLDQYCEWGVIALVIGIILFGPLATGCVRPIDFLVIQTLTAVALILWCLRFWLNQNHRLLFPPVSWAILGFVGLAWFRYQGADFEYVARHELIKVLVYAAIFFLVMSNLHKQETTQLVTLILLTLATLISLYAVYQYVTHSRYVWHFEKPSQYIERGSGTYICPNHLAGFLELVLPLGIAYLFTGRFNYTFKVFLGYGCIVILAGIAATMSRGGWLATGVSLVVLFLLLLRKRQHRIPAAATLIILAVAATITYQKSDKLQSRVQRMNEGGSDAFISARPAIWKAAWEMWQDNRIWGVGPGHFDYRFPKYRPTEIQVRPGRVHNDYLNVLVDWGVVGASVLGVSSLLLIGGLAQARKYVDRASRDLGSSRNSNRSAFVLGGLGSAVALAIHSFFDFNLHVPANAAVAATILALAASHLRFASGRHWLSQWPGSRLLHSIVLIAVAAFLAATGVKTFKEQRFLLQAATHPESSQKRINQLQLAAQVEPNNFENLYNIGEALRSRGASIPENANEHLEASIDWFQAAVERAPEWAFNYIGIGMALDRLGRIDEATPYYERAISLDPNQHLVVAYMGWHQINRGDYPAAKQYFDRSIEIKWWDNHIPLTYLRLIEPMLQEEG
ncbi:MAG: hypothetical protein M2R45_04296 [Verrucomicrobia subdivision 3 bacterium]|nr:hypothetical protein [Limisphaerales bacterium]MCS1417211.1 hypothetical protein [Limisphaerales bacterium]